MNSPYTGMDPYIEACGLWPDFHDDLIGEIKRALALALPERYLVRTGERSYVVLVESGGKESHALYPDVGVSTPATESDGGAAAAVATQSADTGAITMRAFVAEHYRESFVEIHESDAEQRLVTCIEVLSPANKRRGTEGWEVYQRKRQAFLLGAANLVEIDLLRGGHKMPMLDTWPKSPYRLLVCRQSRAPYCQVWPAFFDEPLQVIPVPLMNPDPDVPLALQPMIQAIYARGRYHRSIDYARPLSPAIREDEKPTNENSTSGNAANGSVPGQKKEGEHP